MATTTLTIQQYARSVLRQHRLEDRLTGAASQEDREWLELEIQSHKELTALVYLSSSAHGALELAVALATGRPISDLGRVLCRFDHSNAIAVYGALSVPLRMSTNEQ